MTQHWTRAILRHVLRRACCFARSCCPWSCHGGEHGHACRSGQCGARPRGAIAQRGGGGKLERSAMQIMNATGPPSATASAPRACRERKEVASRSRGGSAQPGRAGCRCRLQFPVPPPRAPRNVIEVHNTAGDDRWWKIQCSLCALRRVRDLARRVQDADGMGCSQTAAIRGANERRFRQQRNVNALRAPPEQAVDATSAVSVFQSTPGRSGHP